MALARRETVSGCLIHSKPIGESTFQGWLFTVQRGLVSVLGQGEVPEKARQADWRLSVRDQRLRLQDFRYTGPLFVQDEQAAYLALYVHELMYRLAPVDCADAELYQAFVQCLVNLNYPDRQITALRHLEFALLNALGQSIDFKTDIRQDPIQTELRYSFRVRDGFYPDPNGPVSGEQVHAASMLDTSVRGAMTLARECLRQQLDSLLDRYPINSRHWLGSRKRD